MKEKDKDLEQAAEKRDIRKVENIIGDSISSEREKEIKNKGEFIEKPEPPKLLKKGKSGQSNLENPAYKRYKKKLEAYNLLTGNERRRARKKGIKAYGQLNLLTDNTD